jgi:hypothetical protein
MSVSLAIDALYDLFKTINGTGSYTYTLTGSDAVSIGIHETPPTSPHVAISTYTEGVGEPGNTLNAVTVTWVVTVVGFVSATTDTEYARLSAADTLYNDLLDAIGGDRTLGGICRDVAPQTPVMGATAQGTIPGYGWFALPLQVEIKRGFVG